MADFSGLTGLSSDSYATILLWEIIIICFAFPILYVVMEAIENKRCEDPDYLQLKKYREYFKRMW